MLPLKRTKAEILEVYDRQVDTVYRICYAYMKNTPEAEDMTQETFLRLMTSGPDFQNERHEKAWLIVTASNLCKDTLKKWWRRHEDIDDYINLPQETQEENENVLDAILQLPQDYKTVVYMHYYEGYTTAEIARHLRCRESTVRSRLARARGKLKQELGGVRK